MQIRRSLSAVLIALVSGAGGSVLALYGGRPKAAYAYVTANLNQRAGPGTQFPANRHHPGAVGGTDQRLPAEDLAWCEGTYGGTRGWMSAQYLRLYDYSRQAWVAVGDYARSTRLATFTFDLDRYWYRLLSRPSVLPAARSLASAAAFAPRRQRRVLPRALALRPLGPARRQDCPEGMRLNQKGNCVPRGDQGD